MGEADRETINKEGPKKSRFSDQNRRVKDSLL